MYSMSSVALTLRSFTALAECFLLFLETAYAFASYLVKLFNSVYLHPPFLLAGSLLNVNLFQRRVTALILQALDLQYSFDILSV